LFRGNLAQPNAGTATPHCVICSQTTQLSNGIGAVILRL
jgi:hypothetical protein